MQSRNNFRVPKLTFSMRESFCSLALESHVDFETEVHWKRPKEEGQELALRVFPSKFMYVKLYM